MEHLAVVRFWGDAEIVAAFGPLDPVRILSSALDHLQNSPMRLFMGWEGDRAALTLINAVRYLEGN